MNSIKLSIGISHAQAGATVMAICLSESEVEARREQSRAERFARTRQGAELLASKEDGKRSYHL